jgi:hypothetical protein
MEQTEPLELMVKQELKDHLVILVSQVSQGQEDQKVHEDLQDFKEKMEFPEALEHKVLKDQLVQEDQLEQLALTGLMVHVDYQESVVPQELKVYLDQLEDLDSKGQ